MAKCGMANDYAIRSQQEVAEILYERGLIEKPDRKIVQWLETKVFRQIRAMWPELENELEADRG